jgi:hypothetical protein
MYPRVPPLFRFAGPSRGGAQRRIRMRIYGLRGTLLGTQQRRPQQTGSVGSLKLNVATRLRLDG